MTDSASVLCTGRLYCDLVFNDLPQLPVEGKEVFAGDFRYAAGGGAYITAFYLAALGRSAGLACWLPPSPFYDILAPELNASGIDLAPCQPAAGDAGPQITVAMVTSGDRAFLTHRNGPSVPATIGATLASRRYRHLHIGELATLADHPELIAMARAAGMTVSLDCSWDSTLLGQPEMLHLIRQTDVFLPNRAEAEALSEHAPVASFSPLVVIKDGAAGAQGLTNGTVCSRPAKPGKAVDTVGAGDAFNSGFLDAWLSLQPLADCLDAGAMSASAAISRAQNRAAKAPTKR